MTNQAKSSLAALALLAMLGLGASGAAQAHGSDVYWSIGMSSPGVTVGVSNAPVVVVPPVIYAPPPVVYPAPVVVAPRPVVYPQPMPVYYGYPAVVRRHHGWEHERGWERRGWERGDYRGPGRGGEYRAAPPLGRH